MVRFVCPGKSKNTMKLNQITAMLQATIANKFSIIYLNEMYRILILHSMKCVPKGPIDRKSFYKMALHMATAPGIYETRQHAIEPILLNVTVKPLI